MFHYRVSKFRVRHGMVLPKVHDFISHKQSKRLEKPIPSNTRKQNEAKNDFEKKFYKLINNGVFGRFLEIIRNRLKLYFVKNCDYDKTIKQQTKLTFSRIHKSYTNYSKSYS